jgi:hypothetical protein
MYQRFKHIAAAGLKKAKLCPFIRLDSTQITQTPYYIDNIEKRNRLINQLYSQIDHGLNWKTVIRCANATQHGERVAEYLIVKSILRQIQPDSILDVGCVLNNVIIAENVRHGRIAFLNPAIEPVVYDEYSYFKMPLANWPYNIRFPFVTCLSTLEHFGFDNTRYGVQETDQGWNWERCIAEVIKSLNQLLTLVEDGGSLLVSCPYGRAEFVRQPPPDGVRTAQVLHAGHVAALVNGHLSKELDITILRLTREGWEASEPDAEFAPYGSIGPGASGLIIMTKNLTI